MNQSQFDLVWPSIEQLVGEVDEAAHYTDSDFPKLLAKIKAKLESVITPEGPVVTDEEKYRTLLGDLTHVNTFNELKSFLYVNGLLSAHNDPEEKVMANDHYLFNPVMLKLSNLLSQRYFSGFPQFTIRTVEDIVKQLEFHRTYIDFLGMFKAGKRPAFTDDAVSFSSNSYIDNLLHVRKKIDVVWFEKIAMGLTVIAMGNDAEKLKAVTYFNHGFFRAEFEMAPYQSMFDEARETGVLSMPEIINFG